MRIRHLKIRNFRGIAELDWAITSDFICLIGAGDSGKTTVLDAISFALSPKWSLPINDADFHHAQSDRPIEIEVTIIDPPSELLPEEPKFGLFLRGWSSGGEIHDDPEEEDAQALTIRFTVDSSLEPKRIVFKKAIPEGKPIYSSDRAKLRVFRVDEQSDQHLGWGRGSALAALTTNLDDLPGTLAAAHRAARDAFSKSVPNELRRAAENAHLSATQLGVSAREIFSPAIHPAAMSHRSALVLSSGAVPATALGLGSRRLTALAVQVAKVTSGSVVIVDEVEHALEPHRLRHLLDRLKRAVVAADDTESTNGSLDQVFLSTHSPITLQELEVGDLYVVHSGDAKMEITRALAALETQGDVDPEAIVRAGAEALLGRRIVVCEGKTEIGFVREVGRYWQRKRQVPVAHMGTVPLLGEGQNNAPKRALGLLSLGYSTSLLMDSDGIPPEDLLEVCEQGVQVIQWADRCAIEERLALDLPESGFHSLVRLVIERLGYEAARTVILEVLNTYLPDNGPKLSSLDSEEWFSIRDLDHSLIRRALGNVAHKKKCFKTVAGGETLGRLVISHIDNMANSDTSKKIKQLELFTYGDS